MIKKIVSLIMVLITFLLCGFTTFQSSMDKDKTQNYENINVDISTNKDGFYTMSSDISIHYYEDNISYISLKEPTLLAYQVSSKYKGGIWVMNLEDGQKIVDDLYEISSELNAMGNVKLAKKVDEAISIISESGSLEQAST